MKARGSTPTEPVKVTVASSSAVVVVMKGSMKSFSAASACTSWATTRRLGAVPLSSRQATTVVVAKGSGPGQAASSPRAGSCSGSTGSSVVPAAGSVPVAGAAAGAPGTPGTGSASVVDSKLVPAGARPTSVSSTAACEISVHIVSRTSCERVRTSAT